MVRVFSNGVERLRCQVELLRVLLVFYRGRLPRGVWESLIRALSEAESMLDGLLVEEDPVLRSLVLEKKLERES